MDQCTNEDQPQDDEAEFILSICWDSALLSGVHYNLTTLELHVSIIMVNSLFNSDLKVDIMI